MKPHPEKVIPQIAEIAIQRSDGDRQRAWTEYIRAMYQATGNLSPRCHAKDFYAYYDQQEKHGKN